MNCFSSAKASGAPAANARPVAAPTTATRTPSGLPAASYPRKNTLAASGLVTHTQSHRSFVKTSGNASASSPGTASTRGSSKHRTPRALSAFERPVLPGLARAHDGFRRVRRCLGRARARGTRARLGTRAGPGRGRVEEELARGRPARWRREGTIERWWTWPRRCHARVSGGGAVRGRVRTERPMTRGRARRGGDEAVAATIFNVDSGDVQQI